MRNAAGRPSSACMICKRPKTSPTSVLADLADGNLLLLANVMVFFLQDPIGDDGPMRAGPRPEVPVRFMTEPPASGEFRVEEGLRDLLSFVARFGDGRVLRDVAGDLRDLSIVKRRVTAPLVHSAQGGKHIGFREPRAPHLAGDASQLGIPRTLADCLALSRCRFVPRLTVAGDELQPRIGQSRDRLIFRAPIFCPPVPPSTRMQRRRRDRITARGLQIHTRGEDLFLHLSARG